MVVCVVVGDVVGVVEVVVEVVVLDALVGEVVIWVSADVVGVVVDVA